MQWGDLAINVEKFAPVLGGLLGGPPGAAVGAAGAALARALGLGSDSTPDVVAQALVTSPDIALKLREVEARCVADQLAAQTAALQAVNETMRAEAASDHWPTYSWRPFCGFIFGVSFFGVYFVLPLAKIPAPTIPTEAWAAMGAVLGVASWFRGKMQADPTIKTDNRG